MKVLLINELIDFKVKLIKTQWFSRFYKAQILKKTIWIILKFIM